MKAYLRNKWALLGAISTIVVVIDQWTKNVVHSRFHWTESVDVIPNLFALTYVRNQGAAFGLLHKAPAYFREPFFLVVPLVAMGLISFVYYRLDEKQRLTASALSLVLGGAIGNLIDRVRFGYVIDFLDFHWKEVYHWPAFNVADSCIVVGVGILFLQAHKQGKDVAAAK